MEVEIKHVECAEHGLDLVDGTCKLLDLYFADDALLLCRTKHEVALMMKFFMNSLLTVTKADENRSSTLHVKGKGKFRCSARTLQLPHQFY